MFRFFYTTFFATQDRHYTKNFHMSFILWKHQDLSHPNTQPTSHLVPKCLSVNHFDVLSRDQNCIAAHHASILLKFLFSNSFMLACVNSAWQREKCLFLFKLCNHSKSKGLCEKVKKKLNHFIMRSENVL